MNAPAFDTLRAAKALREAGFEEAQAEAIVITVGRAMSENVATKTDVAGVNANMAEFRAEMDSGFAGVDSRFAAVHTEMSEFRADVDSKFAAVTPKFTEVDAKFTKVDARFTEVDAKFAELRTYIAEEFKALYRHLWVMGVGIVVVTVTLVKLMP